MKNGSCRLVGYYYPNRLDQVCDAGKFKAGGVGGGRGGKEERRKSVRCCVVGPFS